MLVDKLIEKNWSNSFKLNFTIPSYNRIENLLEVIENFKLCKNSNFGVIILDNASPDFNLNKINNSLNNIEFGLKLYRNKVHIGPDANLLRCMELSKSEWIYMLGDSKILREDAVEIIINDIISNNKISSIVYSFDKVLSKSTVITNLDHFFMTKIKFGDLFLGGNSLVKRNSFEEFYPIASMLTLSRSMLSIFHILNLNESKAILFSEKRIVKKFIKKPNKYDPGLSLLECWAQFGLLTTLKLRKKHQKKLNKLIINNEKYSNYLIFIKFCLIQIFRNKKEISSYLKKIINYRYVHHPFSIEKLFVFPLLFLSNLIEKIGNYD